MELEKILEPKPEQLILFPKSPNNFQFGTLMAVPLVKQREAILMFIYIPEQSTGKN